MNFLKTQKGQNTIIIVILIMIAIMFVNQYFGPNSRPMFAFMKGPQEPQN